MLHLILADSELETIPSEIASHKSIRWKARRRGRRATELILDSNYFHKPMRKLSDSHRRGRPDILHVCMLAALDSPLNREGMLRLYVHTRHEKVIEVNPETRIPRSYNRFVGLMEQLFLIGEVPPEKPLLRLHDEALDDLVKRIGPERIIAFDEGGQKMDRNKMFGGGAESDLCMIIGGFPHGKFRSKVSELADELVKIYPESVEVLTALTHAICFYEEEFGILDKL